MYRRSLVAALAAGTAIAGTLIPAMSSATADHPSLLGCAADSAPPTTVPEDDGSGGTAPTETTVDEAPTTTLPDEVDTAPSTEAAGTEAPATPPSSSPEVDTVPAAPPLSAPAADEVPVESVPALSDGVAASATAAASGFGSTREPAADPIKHRYEITVKVTTVKGKTKIDKWEFTPHGNPCRLTGVDLGIGLGGEPGSYYEYYTLVITDPALDKDKCRPLIYVNGSSTALTGVTRVEANPNFTAIFKFDRKDADEIEFRIVIECT